MGDEAEALHFTGLDNEDLHGGDDNRPFNNNQYPRMGGAKWRRKEPAYCKYCLSSSVKWVDIASAWTKSSWRLMDKGVFPYRPHVCINKPKHTKPAIGAVKTAYTGDLLKNLVGCYLL